MKRRILLATAIALLITGIASASPISKICDEYLDAYFKMYPTRATEAGRHDFDGELEDLSAKRIATWLEFNRSTRGRVLILLNKETAPDDVLDAGALLGQIDHELNALERLHRAERDPLYWSSVIGNANVFLLVRDDLPPNERQKRALARTHLLPRFAEQAIVNFKGVDSANVAPEFFSIAAGQVRSSAKFYREGFPAAVGDVTKARDEGNAAATALEKLASLLDDIGKRATGSPRLGPAYATSFRLGTRLNEPVPAVLERASADLNSTRNEIAHYGRSIWKEVMGDKVAPNDDRDLVRQLFQRIAADHDDNVEQALADWRNNVKAINALVHDRKIMTLPDPLTLIVDLSPPFFVGQSVGGVYPPGPYAPEAKTILFIPAPSPDATAEQRAGFFRDFNRHFNKMIVPHELIPGHYVQFKVAARQSHKVRAVFPDPLYVEGWGTFCERLMNDQGWGGPLERVAHFKKQLENIARTIVDIRVHTEYISRDDVIKFVKEEALQDDQFAANMWTRALTTSPQITTYYLGYAKVRQAYEAAQAAQGEKFELQKFMDGMMEMGPVNLDRYVETFSGESAK